MTLAFCCNNYQGDEQMIIKKTIEGDLEYISKSYNKNPKIIEIKDDRGLPLPHLASEHGRANILEFFLDEGFSAGLTDEEGLSPLFLAKTAEIADLLLRHGANVNARDSQGNTPLHFSVMNGNIDVTQYLIDNGANVNAAMDDGPTFLENGWTPLHIAAVKGNTQLLNILIENGSNINSTGTFNDTPLHAAVAKNNVNCVHILLERGADRTIKMHNGKSAEDIAKEKDNLEALRLLNIFGWKDQ